MSWQFWGYIHCSSLMLTKTLSGSHTRQPLSEIYGEEKWKGYIVTVVKN